MSRIRYVKVSEETGEEVPSEHIVKGVEVSKGRYVIVDPDELAPFVPLATKSDRRRGVRRPGGDRSGLLRVELPRGPASEREAVRVCWSRRCSPRARWRSSGSSCAAAGTSRRCVPIDGHLVMSTLAYADELVAVEEVEELAGLGGVDVSDREVKMAEMLVESLTATFEPGKYDDDYRVQVLDLIAKRAAGEEFELTAVNNEEPKVVDMMAALEASVEAAKAARKRHPDGPDRRRCGSDAVCQTGDEASRPQVPPDARGPTTSRANRRCFRSSRRGQRAASGADWASFGHGSGNRRPAKGGGGEADRQGSGQRRDRRTSASPTRRAPKDVWKRTGNYPMPDRGHAISAVRLAKKHHKTGKLSKADYDRVRRKAHRRATLPASGSVIGAGSIGPSTARLDAAGPKE